MEEEKLKKELAELLERQNREVEELISKYVARHEKREKREEMPYQRECVCSK